MEGAPIGAPSRLLDHVICEDLGATLGGALGRLFVEQSAAVGVNGCGVGVATIDEAVTRVVVPPLSPIASFLLTAASEVPDTRRRLGGVAFLPDVLVRGWRRAIGRVPAGVGARTAL
ncbi:MAG: hypothetical protein WCI75_11490 [candidate division NC10 bacterium]